MLAALIKDMVAVECELLLFLLRFLRNPDLNVFINCKLYFLYSSIFNLENKAM
jgi:hypothetical protein